MSADDTRDLSKTRKSSNQKNPYDMKDSSPTPP